MKNKTAPSVESAARPSLFVVGDSISVHYGPFLERALAGSCVYDRKGGAAEALANLDVPRGSNGGDSSMVLEYLNERLAEPAFQPDLLLFNAGLHDIKRQTPEADPKIDPDAYGKNLREIVEALRSRRIAAAWMRTTPCRDAIHNEKNRPSFFRFERDLALYNEMADAVMQAEGIPMIDLHGFTLSLEEKPEVLFCDHVHFHPGVRALQGAFLAGWTISYFDTARF